MFQIEDFTLDCIQKLPQIENFASDNEFHFTKSSLHKTDFDAYSECRLINIAPLIQFR